jgi:hypothetical protein
MFESRNVRTGAQHLIAAMPLITRAQGLDRLANGASR